MPCSSLAQDPDAYIPYRDPFTRSRFRQMRVEERSSKLEAGRNLTLALKVDLLDTL